MKFPSKKAVEKVFQSKGKGVVRLTPQAASLALLYHWLFLKKLASTVDHFAFRQKKVLITDVDVMRCSPNVLLAFNEYEKVRRRRLAKENRQPGQENVSRQSNTDKQGSKKQARKSNDSFKNYATKVQKKK